jgi:hypothetical protein
MVLKSKNCRLCEERQRRGNLLVTDPTGQGDCFAAFIAMDTQSTRDARGAGSGKYAGNAAVRRFGAITCRNDVFW